MGSQCSAGEQEVITPENIEASYKLAASTVNSWNDPSKYQSNQTKNHIFKIKRTLITKNCKKALKVIKLFFSIVQS
jgi:hypothetical protein